MKPRKSILDATFQYANAASTDIRATWERVQQEEKDAAELRAKEAEFNQHRIIAIGRKRA